MNCRHFVRRPRLGKVLSPTLGIGEKTWHAHCRLKQSSPQSQIEVNEALLAAGFTNSVMGTYCPATDGKEPRCPFCAP